MPRAARNRTAGVVETEKSFQAALVDLARRYQWRVYHPFDSRRSVAGFPDLTLARPGELIFAEVKTAAGRVSAVQQQWLDLLRTMPGIEVYVWRPDDFPAIEARLKRRQTHHNAQEGTNGPQGIPREGGTAPGASEAGKTANPFFGL